MNIVRLEIKGFRSLRDILWEPAALNVVIGPNGTGKSNLLRMLELISCAARGGLGKHVQSLGGMGPLVWDGSSDTIEFKVKTTPVEADRDPQKESLTYTVKMNRLGMSSAYRIGFEELGKYYPVESGERQSPFRFLFRSGHTAKVFDQNEQGLVVPTESVLEEETLLSLSAGAFAYSRYIPLFRSQFAEWSIYHDLHVDSEAKIRQSQVTRYEQRVEPGGQNLASVLHTLYTNSREFKTEIDEAMKAAFGDDFVELVFPPAADQRIQLGVRWKTLNRSQSAADLSDGTLRFLFLLTIFASPSPAPLIAVDEPETGLHPSMLPIVAEYAVDAAARAQVIITTHSPEFLDAFGEEKPTTTVATWSGGETLLKKLEGDALDYWLREYSLGELFKSGELEGMK